jgi:RNA polymerase sigma factor (sigma-70 family)
VNRATEPAELVRRIIAGDSQAEEEMILRYRAGVFQIINNVVHNWSVAEDLCQEALIKSLEKIRHNEVREPEKLSGFICAIARFMAIEYMRKVRATIKTEGIGMAETIPDPAPDPVIQLLDKEKCETVRKVINEMKVERDREVLFRYYILEEDRDTLCNTLGLTREQFSSIIFRAHQRYKALHEKLSLDT